MENLYRNWIKAFESANLPPLTADTCCRLLAIVYVFGGNSEEFTQNDRLTADIEYAQRRLNIGGSLIPNGELLPIAEGYIQELEDALKNSANKKDGSYIFEKDIDIWAIEFMKSRYNVKLI